MENKNPVTELTAEEEAGNRGRISVAVRGFLLCVFMGAVLSIALQYFFPGIPEQEAVGFYWGIGIWAVSIISGVMYVIRRRGT